MYRRGTDDPRKYTDEQRRRNELWLEEGDGPGHYQKQCLVCGSWFMAAQNNARFCDRRCYLWWWSRPPKECVVCGEVVLPTPTPGALGEHDFHVATKQFIDEAGRDGETVGNKHSAVATLDFPSIAAHAGAELTIPVTGAAIGDVCSASPSTTLEAGLVWSAWVSATDVARIRVGNLTAGAINPASRSWRVDVWKL